MKRKNLSEESDLTILKEWESQQALIPSVQAVVFYTFMIFLYYSELARWFYWTMVVLLLLGAILYSINKIVPYRKTIYDELKSRGYSR